MGDTLKKIRLRELTIDPSVSPRKRLDRARVEEYASILENMPPITAFTHDGMKLLADGFHRVEAAKLRGWDALPCVEIEGDWWDAYVFSVRENAKHGAGLNQEEKNSAIARLAEERDWGYKKIAHELGFPEGSVQMITDQLDIKRSTSTSLGTPVEVNLHVAHALAPTKDPKEKAHLAKAAKERKWTPAEAKLARENVESPQVPKKFKQELLAGKADPVVVQEGRPVGMLSETVAREVKNGIKNASVLILNKMLQAWLDLQKSTPEQTIESCDVPHLKLVVSDALQIAEYFERLDELARQRLELPKLIKGG